MSSKKHFSGTSVATSSHQVQLPSGVSLHVERKGEGGHGIVCVPAALATALFSFVPQLQHFGRQGSPFTIVAFDPRGYGGSRPPERDFSIKPVHFLEQDAIDAHDLMQQLGFNSYSVLGWCNGATTGMFLAARQPQAVTKLVIWGGIAYLTQEDIDLYKTKLGSIADWSPEYREPLEKVYAGSARDLASLWSEWMDSSVAKLKDGGDLCKSELSKIQCPTLVLHGDKDPIMPPFHPTYINEHIAGSRLKSFPEGKHNIHLKYAQEFNEEVEKFLLS